MCFVLLKGKFSMLVRRARNRYLVVPDDRALKTYAESS